MSSSSQIIGKKIFYFLNCNVLIIEFVFLTFSLNSLFSIPRNKRFVCVNTNLKMRTSPITESVNRLLFYICQKEKSNFNSDNTDQEDSDDEIRPFKGFAKPLNKYKNVDETIVKPEKTNRLLHLIDEHVEEALQNGGFDDSIAKYKGKNHFVVRFSTNCINKLKDFLTFHSFQDSIVKVMV